MEDPDVGSRHGAVAWPSAAQAASAAAPKEPGAERLKQYTEAWLCLLQQATAEAVREAAAAAEQQQLAARPQADGPPRPRPPWAPAAPPEEHPLASLGSNATGAAACAAAGASGGAHGLAEKVAPAVSRFSVCVPKQYPGVQYRKSKNLSDRYQRYAEHGSVVAGVIEGEWLKLNSKVFLPVRVNGMQILEPLADDASDSKVECTDNKTCWFSCGAFTAAQDKEFLTHIDEPN